MTDATILKELTEGRKIVIHTIGVSMKPLLRERRTHVIIKPLNEPKNNDIMLYQRSNGKLVLHRLIRQTEQAYYMRGDNTYSLERIEKNTAFGVVEGIFDGEKYIDINSKRYKAYVALWNSIYPMRHLYVKLRHGAARLSGVIKRKSGSKGD